MNGENIGRLIDAPSASEVLKTLSQNSGYDFSGISKTDEYEMVLRDELKRTYDLLYKLSASNDHRDIIDIPASKYDFHNIKVAVKSKYLNKKYDYLYYNITDISPEAIADYAVNDKNNLPEYIIDAAAAADSAYSETKNPRSIDIVVDKRMFSHMLDLCTGLDNDFVTEYVKKSIDIYNVRTLTRCKDTMQSVRFFDSCLADGGVIPKVFFTDNYNKTINDLESMFYYKYLGDIFSRAIPDYERKYNFSTLERLFDNYLLEHAKMTKYIAFGPEILFSYIIFKENEIRQIRIIMTCKSNNIPAETLRERLRDNYA